MITLDNVTGSQALYTADGGPGQKKWHCIRMYAELASGTAATATLKVNGADPTAQDLELVVTSGSPDQLSTHLLLTTGDAVSVLVTGQANVVVGANVDTDEV